MVSSERDFYGKYKFQILSTFAGKHVKEFEKGIVPPPTPVLRL